MDKRDSLPGAGENRQPGQSEADEWSFFERPEKSSDKTEKTKEILEKEASEKAGKTAQEKKQKEEKARKDREADDKKLEQQTESRLQRRRRSVEKSRRIIRELGDNEHRSLSPLETVQLVVAERIAHLGSQLDGDEPLSDADMRALERQFDFFGHLSDKLADPEAEIPPEVEEVYQQIIESTDQFHDSTADQSVEQTPAPQQTAESLFESISRLFEPPDAEDQNKEVTPGDTAVRGVVVDSGGDSSPTQSYAPEAASTTPVRGVLAEQVAVPEPERSRHVSHTATLAFAIAALAIIRRKKRKKDEESPAEHARPTQAVRGVGLGAITKSALPTRREYDAANSLAAHDTSEKLERRAHARALSSWTIHNTTTAAPLAQPLSEQRLATPDAPGNLSHTVPNTRFETNSRPAPSTTGYFEKPTLAGEPFLASGDHVSLPDTPVEAWSLGDMLRAAEGISLGHGQYLRQAYDRGEIDREGLVKVLKDWKKGRNYTPTFDAQRASLARRRAESHEYLREDRTQKSPQSHATSPDDALADSPDAFSDSSLHDDATTNSTDTASLSDTTPSPINTPSQNNIDPPDTPRILTVVIIVTVVTVVTFAVVVAVFFLS